MSIRDAFPKAKYIDLSSGAQTKAGGSIDISAEVEEDEVIEGAAAGGESLPVPTSANKKSEIQHYLTYEHGIDPDDLDMTKDELLSLVADLTK